MSLEDRVSRVRVAPTLIVTSVLTAAISLGALASRREPVPPRNSVYEEHTRGPEGSSETIASVFSSQYARSHEPQFANVFERRRELGHQDPGIGYFGCGDSACGGLDEASGLGFRPNEAFRGSLPANAVITQAERRGRKVTTLTESAGYFLLMVESHEKHAREHKHGGYTHWLVIEGHSDCGGMAKILDGEAAIEQVADVSVPLANDLLFIRRGLTSVVLALGSENYASLTPDQKKTVLAQAAVDYQIDSLLKMPRVIRLCRSGALTLVGCLRDLNGTVGSHDEYTREGQISFTNINGLQEPARIVSEIQERVGDKVPWEAIRFSVRRASGPVYGSY